MTEVVCSKPEETFAVGETVGRGLSTGDIVLLFGGLGAGKTLFTKGIMKALDYDTDEVTSPSFTLVNLYQSSKFDVYHIDLWRLDDNAKAAEAVGLNEILEKEDSVTIIEWPDRLNCDQLEGRVLRVSIEGDGDEPRRITMGSEPTRKI
ncbi:MAG: tRNA (adenosine(37)-N6)-threonylcarbamoyltransferase complex ATPase subunit type 1 TsaE [Pyrinomonadaceae bacterium]